MNIIYKQIEEFHDYEISNYGEIYEIETGELAEYKKQGRIWHVKLYNESSNKCFLRSVQKLVAMNFMDDYDPKYTVRMKDSNGEIHVDNLYQVKPDPNSKSSKLKRFDFTETDFMYRYDKIVKLLN